MLNIQDKEAIIYRVINSAICIDDQYESPYCDISKDCKYFDDSKKMYTSFREKGKCNLDIYKFQNYYQFCKDKDFLLNHKDLMILDWELDVTSQVRHESTLKVLGDAVDNRHIRWVAIYTNEQNDYNILLNIYAYFCIRKTYDELNEEINDKIAKVSECIEENSELEDVETDLKKKLNDLTSAFTLNSKEEQIRIIKELRQYIYNLFPLEKREYCKKIGNILKEDLGILLTYYEIVRGNLRIINRTDEKKYSIHIMGRSYLLINGTVVFVLKKEITPDNVYKKVTEAICKIPNQRTLLLSLMLKNILSEELGIVGKGLGGITDRMLLHHWESYEEKNIDNLIEFLVLCVKEDIAESMRTYIDTEKIEKLFGREVEEKKDIVAEQELALFNKIITFIDKRQFSNQEHHQIKTGDIFRLKTRLYPIYSEDNSEITDFEEYIVCVSQSCDCLRPTKIHNNYAFTYGKTYGVKLGTALRNIEKDNCYSIISDNQAIKWNDSFLTIYIPKNIFNINDCITVQIENKDIILEYVGGLKDFYAQRIVNNIFNHALRIGVDLPHFK